ncbi:MAG: hypothetical protein ACOVSR_09750 [Bacteroidia bacterium]
MIYENILKIKDIIGSNFLSFDDEMIPSLTFVSPDKYNDNIQEFDAIISEFNNSRKYEIECIDSNVFGDIFKYKISPRYYQLDNGIAFVSKEWSIEEMIEIIVNLNK